MHRGIALALLPGCSLILNFSDSAAPKDAMIDAPYTQDECDYKEPNDTPDIAAPVTPADTGPAAICASTTGADDIDYYRFTVPAMAKVTVSINFTQRTGGDLDLKITDLAGTTIAQSRGFGSSETIVCPAASPPCGTLAAGDYLFAVFPGMGGNVNDYTFALMLQ